MMGADPRAATRFTAVGDLLLGDSPISVGFGLHSRYPGRSLESILVHAREVLSGRDIVLGNLESPLTRVGVGTSRWRRDQMRGDPAYASVLRDAGITALHVANNHALQHGRAGFDETIAALEEAGIACVGIAGDDTWCSRPVISNALGKTTVGILGYCWRPRQYGTGSQRVPFAEGTPDDAIEDIVRLRGSCDAVVVSLHWGEDFVDEPSHAEVATAHALVDAGAAIVVGHHPQVRRPVERYAGGIIAYSLGNFVADLLWLQAFRRGTVLHADLGNDSRVEPFLEAVWLDSRFAPTPESPSLGVTESITGLDPVEYAARARDALREQQRRAYGYALRQLGRYPVRVLADLLVTTIQNKLRRSSDARLDGSAP